MSKFENIEGSVPPEVKLGLVLNDLVELNFMPGFRGRIKVFKYNENGERIAEIKNAAGEDFSAKLDQIKKLE